MGDSPFQTHAASITPCTGGPNISAAAIVSGRQLPPAHTMLAPIQQPRRRKIAARVQEVSLRCAYTSGQVN
jgi:hypothetical protein